MAVRTGKAEAFGQDAGLGRLVETRVADPTGRWRDAPAVLDALAAQGVAVVTVEWGDAGQGDEVRVLADKAVTDRLTALPVPPDPLNDLAVKIGEATTVEELRAILAGDILPRLTTTR